MRVDGQGYVAGQRRHFDGKHSFSDHLARARADDANAKYAFGMGIEEKLGQAFGPVNRDGAAGGSPGKFSDFDLAIFFLRLRFRQATPGDFGIGEYDRRNGVRFEGNFVSGDGFDRDAIPEIGRASCRERV